MTIAICSGSSRSESRLLQISFNYFDGAILMLIQVFSRNTVVPEVGLMATDFTVSYELR